MDNATTSNKLVCPSAGDGLSAYICQFSSQWWPSEAVRCIVIVVNVLLILGLEPMGEVVQLTETGMWKLHWSILSLTYTRISWIGLHVDLTVLSGFLLTAAAVSDLWNVLWDQQKNKEAVPSIFFSVLMQTHLHSLISHSMRHHTSFRKGDMAAGKKRHKSSTSCCNNPTNPWWVSIYRKEMQLFT